MHITFDPAKDRQNIVKHGVSLALAESLEWGLMICQEDDREGYGELRLQCFAPMGARLYCVVLTEDKDQYRIISLREATNREKRCYMDHI